MTVQVGAPFLLGVLVGIGVALVGSLVVSLSSLRLQDDYFVIATFGLQVIVFSVFNNWTSLTHGTAGISGIPQPVIFRLARRISDSLPTCLSFSCGFRLSHSRPTKFQPIRPSAPCNS